MITAEQKQFINKHVNPESYDVERLIKYLSMHNIVGAEIFHYCEKHESGGCRTLPAFYEDNDIFTSMDVNTFIRRVPFFFYTPTPNRQDDLGSFGELVHIFDTYVEKALDDKDHYEPIFATLEHLYYDLHLPLEEIFSYWINQSGKVDNDTFFKWTHYVELIECEDSPDYFPDRFITAYNYTLEEAGLPPVIYEIQDKGIVEPFFRNGSTIQFGGSFPCDEDGNPIMKWIGLTVKNAASITCNCKKSRVGDLTVEITPQTIIHARNFYNNRDDDDDVWYQLYAGPLNMEFDYQALRYNRDRLGYTQQQVADAVGTSVRTYQKWEAGNTIPDGYFLIRLLNWLDIPDIQNITKYKED